MKTTLPVDPLIENVATPLDGAEVVDIVTVGALLTIPPVELTIRGSTRSSVPETVTGLTSLRTLPEASRSCRLFVAVGGAVTVSCIVDDTEPLVALTEPAPAVCPAVNKPLDDTVPPVAVQAIVGAVARA